MHYQHVPLKDAKGMHECVCGSVWACVLASWASSSTETVPRDASIVPCSYGETAPAEAAHVEAAHVSYESADSWSGFC